MNKKAVQTGTVLLLVVIAIALVWSGALDKWIKPGAAPATPTATGAGSTVCAAGEAYVTKLSKCMPKCYVESTTLTVGPTERAFVPTTKLTSEYHRVYLNGVDKGRYLDGNTLTVSPYDTLKIIYAENDTAAVGAGYYAASQDLVVPCEGAVTSAGVSGDLSYKLYRIDSNNLSIKVFNENNGNLNSVSDNQTIAAGDTKSLRAVIDGTYQDAFSPYGYIIAAVEGNSTTWKKLILGSEANTVPCPTLQASKAIRSVDTAWCYKISAANDFTSGATGKGSGMISNGRIDTAYVLQAQTGINPTATAGNQDINTFWYDQDWYQNSISGVEEFGAETDTYTDVGGVVLNTTISVS